MALTTICDFDVTKLEALTKIVNALSNCEYLCFREGKLSHFINQIIIHTDLSIILGDDFELDIIRPKEFTKSLKAINSKNKAIKFAFDDEYNRYVLIIGNNRVFLPKKSEYTDNSILEKLKLTPMGGAIEIDKTAINEIRDNVGIGEIKLLIHDSKFKGVFSERGEHIFTEYEDDAIDSNDCEQFIAYGFMLIKSDMYHMQVGRRNNTEDELWLITKTEIIDNIELLTYENLVRKELINLF